LEKILKEEGVVSNEGSRLEGQVLKV